MSQGNLGVQYLYQFNGNPEGLSHLIFNAPENSLVFDTTNNVLRLKTSPRGDNSGFLVIGSTVAPLVLKDVSNGNYYSLTINGGQPKLTQVAAPIVPANVNINPAMISNDTASGARSALYISGGELKAGVLPSSSTAVPILYDQVSQTSFQITSDGGQIKLVPLTPP